MPIETLTVIKLLLDAFKLLDGKFTNNDQKDFTKLLRALVDFRYLGGMGATPAFTKTPRSMPLTTCRIRSIVASVTK